MELTSAAMDSAKILHEMQEILPGLFLSGVIPADSEEMLKEKGITHIVQMTDVRLPRYPGKYLYKVLCVPDWEKTNLIKHFPETNRFIADALGKGGKVLVHCVAGASRSPTIVCAYLMKEQKLKVEEALEFVRTKRPLVGPNQGFMSQLQMYYDIGYDVNTSHTQYRRFLIESMAVERQTFGYINDMVLAQDPMTATAAAAAATSIVPNASSSSSASPSLAESTTTKTPALNPARPPVARPAMGRPASAGPRPLKCKKCRRALVSRDAVITHFPGQGQASFQYRKRDGTLHVSEAVQSNISPIQPAVSTTCQSYFIEPIEWIQGLHELEGKISCPKCDSKLGTFSWVGEQCSCGSWVTPAFMLHKGKVDG
ncbi:dual specificity phosphatase 12 [Actinomortierella ambigua]|nr:dual specificity phosphatase 12 [Actinomortierella ambigua]